MKTIRLTLLILWLGLSLRSLQAQDTTLAASLFDRAGKALEDESPDSAFLLFRQAAEGYYNGRAYDRWLIALDAALQASGDTRADSLLAGAFRQLNRQTDETARWRAQLYRLAGELSQDRGEWARAEEQYRQGLALAEKAEGKESLAAAQLHNALGETSVFQSNLPEALEHFEAALVIRRRRLGERHRDVTQSLNNLGAACRLSGRYEEAAYYHQQAIDIGARILPPGDPDMASYLNNAGVLARERGRYRDAIAYYRRALAIFGAQGREGTQNLAITSNNIAICFKALGDYAQALDYYRQALTSMREALGPDHPFVATILDNLGTGYAAMEDFEAAREAHAQALAIRRRRLPERHESIAASYYNLATDFRRLNRPDSALYYSRLALDRYRGVDGEAHPRTGLALFGLGQAYQALRQPGDALPYFQQALAVQQSVLPPTHPDLAQTLIAWGQTLLTQKDFDGAARQFGAALDRLLPQWRSLRRDGSYPAAIPANPPLFYFNALRGLAEARAGSGRPGQALASCRLLFQVLDSIRFSYRFEGSKLELAAQVRPHLEWALGLIHRLAGQSHKKEYQELAFTWIEKSRSFLLYEAMLSNQAFRDGRVPADMQQREQELRGDLVLYEKKIAEEELNGEKADESRLERWRQRLLESRREYEQLSARLEKKYPDYFRLRRDDRLASLPDVQRWLPDEETALISYWAGDSTLFAMVIRRGESRFLALPIDFPLDEQIEGLRRSLYEPFLTGTTAIPPGWGNYPKLAAGLYDRLLAPLGTLPSRLIILPDGRLGYLPFDVLLTKEPSADTAPRQWPFLLRRHRVSYAWSASLLLSAPKPRGRLRLLGVAPQFPPVNPANSTPQALRDALGPLAFNEEEVRATARHFPGTTLLGAEATEERFRALAPRYRLIHLASHARAYDEAPLLSRIAFTAQPGDTLNDGFLDVAELYALPLKADLVVLSACETGTGALRHGEGIYSLGRAFAYAGAHSLLTTLWRVDDAATATLMDGFYQYLYDGLPKDEALRRAQLDYLDQADPLHAHPFFWAGYALTGNTAAVSRGEMPNWGLLIGGGGGLLLLFALGWRRRFSLRKGAD